jgi:Tfp pilus assembly protein PilN
MRPVNLIPEDERRGSSAPLRTGPLAYLVVGALVALLAAVTALVLIGNQVTEREDELAKLHREDAAARVKAARLAPYTEFRKASEERVATVQSLADSRFDWERVMRELSLILPGDVWLVSLSATAAPGASAGSEVKDASSGLRVSVKGPALELTGCAAGQEAVAGFVTALKDIDGVTRVGVQSSELPDRQSGAGVAKGGSGQSSSDDCRTRQFIAKFTIVVAFDAAPVPPTTEGAEEAPATPAGTAEEVSSKTSEKSGEATEGG